MGKTIYKKENVSVQEFYEEVKRNFEGNDYNHIIKVSISIDDGLNPVHIEYITPADSNVKFSKRKGRLEIKTG